MKKEAYCKTIVVDSPKQEKYGLVTVGVRPRGKLNKKRLTAVFVNGSRHAVDLKCGDEVWVCLDNGDAGPIIKHNLLMRLWTLIRY